METETSTDRRTNEILEATADLRRHLRQNIGPAYKFQAGPDIFRNHKVGACVFPPDEQKPYWTICTVGMSSIEMVAAPAGAQCAELLISLPETWDWSNPKNAWPLNLLWTMAELIATNRNAAIIAGEQIRTRNSAIPIFTSADRPAGGVWFRHPALLTEKASSFKRGAKNIQWLAMIPLFQEEFEYIEKNGENEFIDLLDDYSICELFDRRRKSALSAAVTSSNTLSDMVSEIAGRVGTALHWVSATRESTKKLIGFDISLIAGYVASKQRDDRLNRAQCALLCNVFDETNYDVVGEAGHSFDDYVKTHAEGWKTTRPQLPSARLNLFRKCDIVYKTEFANFYYAFLLRAAEQFLDSSDSMSDEHKENCRTEIESSLKQNATGLVDDGDSGPAFAKLANSLNIKIAELSLAGLLHNELRAEFEWLNRHEVSIEYVLHSLVREVILLNHQNEADRLSFLNNIAPCLNIFGPESAREFQLDELLDDDGALDSGGAPPWVELVAFANQLQDPKFKTVALELLCEFGAALLNAASPLKSEEIDWRDSVLEALDEARMKSEVMDAGDS